MKQQLFFLYALLLLLPTIHSANVNTGNKGIETLPAHAIKLDPHRYFYIEKWNLISKDKNDQLIINIRIGSDYNIQGGLSFSMPWDIATESRYLFELRSEQIKKPIKSSGQFDIVRGLEGAKAVSIEVKFTIPKDLDLKETHLYFTGKPKVKKGASIIPSDQ